MSPEEFVAHIKAAPSLPGDGSLISSIHGLIPFVKFSVRVPRSLWHYSVEPWVWKLPQREIAFRDLVTAQPHLARDKLLVMVKDRNLDKLRRGPVIVLQQDGKLLLFDGNHRSTILRLFGDRTTAAIVLDV